MKQIWSARVAQAAAKYGESAPTAAVCCNACRTCLTTNLIGLATAGLAAAGYGLARITRRTN
jgi:threonine aldolase